jgi:hypothetical protein
MAELKTKKTALSVDAFIKKFLKRKSKKTRLLFLN